MTPTPQQIEAAAKAIHDESCKRMTLTIPWEKLVEREQTCYFAYAKTALETL